MARIGVLGPLTVDGVEGRLPPREQVVLAALTVRRSEVVSAETLADAWWGEQTPPTWSKALQGCLVQLRKVLGAGAIETRPHGYCLVVPADEVDACRFERQVARARELLTLGEADRAAYVVDEALGLWRGPALVDLDRWEAGRVEAARLQGLRLDAEELRLDATIRAGRFREVLGEAQTRVAEEPLREERWRLLALSEYQAGRQGEALRALHRARGVLAEELGLDPGPDLVTLEEAILRQDPSLVAAQLPEPSPVCPYLGLVAYDIGDADAFFGRDAAVSDCLRRLVDAGVLAVVGPSGSGKSSVVRAGIAAALERDGRRVVVITPGARPMDVLPARPASNPAPVLVVDQSEEAVTLCTDADERSAFFAALAEQIIEQLIRARLVTSHQDAVELAHEALARAWPRLRAWLDDDVEGQRMWRHLAVAAESWEAMGRPDSELYRGVRLDRAVEWRGQAGPDLNTAEREFLDASRRAADVQRRDARRRRRTLTAVLAVAAAVAAILGSVAAVQADRATSERDRALAAEAEAQVGALVNRSLALRSTDRAAAALLAVEAHRRAPGDPGVHSALLGTFTGAPGFMGYLHMPAGSQPLAGAAVPGTDTAVVAVGGLDLRLLELDTGTVTRRFPPVDAGGIVPLDPTYATVRVSADGRYVAHLVPTEADHPCFEIDLLRATDDAGCAALLVYEIASGERVLGPVTPPVGPGDVAINADGSLVAVAGGYDGTVALYRTDTAQPIGTVPGVPRPTGAENLVDTAAVAFGPDGRLYVGSLAGPVRAVDPATMGVVASFDAPAAATHNNLAVTDRGLLVGSGDTTVVAIGTDSGTVHWSSDITVPGDPFPCPFFAVSEPVGRVYCGDVGGVLQERELATGQLTGVRLDPQVGSVGALSMAAGGRELVAFGEDVPVVSRWRLDGSGPIVDTSLPGWGTNGYDPAGELMVVFEGERSSLQDLNPSAPAPPDFAAWDPATSEVVDQLDGLLAAIWTTPGTLAGAWTDGTVGDSYDVRRHTRAPGPPDRGGVVHSAGLTAGGTRTYVVGHFDDDGSDGRCEVWSVDIATRQYAGPVIDIGPCPPVGSAGASASADGARVAFTYPMPEGWTTDVYDGRTGEKLGGPLHGQFTAVIGPDGTLYGGDVAGKVTQYDLETLEPIGTFPQARGRIEALEFSADGRLLLVGSANQNVSIYDVATRSRIGDPIDTGRPIVGGNAGPVLRPDGKAVAVNGRDGLAVWTIEPDRLAEAACRLAGRNLTRSEWDTYLGNLGGHRATCPDNP